MKKVLTALAPIGFLVALIAPTIVLAAVTVTISSPTTGSSITTPMVTVSGVATTVAMAAISSVTVNGVSAVLTPPVAESTNYSVSIPCASTITATATDSTGEIGTTSVTVTCSAGTSTSEKIPSMIQGCTMRHVLTGTDWTNRGITCPALTATNGGPTAAAVAAGSCYFANTTYTCGVCCVMNTIYTVTDWIFVAVVVIVIIFILWGAYNLLTSQADPAKIKLGRDQIMYAAIGMLVALLAKAIPLIVRSILGA